MTPTGDISVRVRLDTSGFESEMRRLARTMETAGGAFRKAGWAVQKYQWRRDWSRTFMEPAAAARLIGTAADPHRAWSQAMTDELRTALDSPRPLSAEEERRDHTIKALARLVVHRSDHGGDAAIDDLRGLIGYLGWTDTSQVEAALRWVLDPLATPSPAAESGLRWRQAVVAVVEACDTELDGGAASDFERGADAAYNWVLSVIDGEVLAAVRALRATPGDLQPDREDVKP